MLRPVRREWMMQWGHIGARWGSRVKSQYTRTTRHNTTWGERAVEESRAQQKQVEEEEIEAAPVEWRNDSDRLRRKRDQKGGACALNEGFP